MENYSVLTTIYKNDKPEFIRQSIDSMLKQTVITNDYVIIKDGPVTPEIELILKEYEYKYKFFNIFQLEKQEQALIR